MASRRSFLTTTGLIASSAALPLMGATNPKEPVIHDYSFAIPDDELWMVIRKQLLVPETMLYLNTGSLGPSPLVVMESVHKAIRQLEMNPVTENWGHLGNQMDEVRKKIATYINASEEEILLTRNTTEGLSLITQGLDLRAGDEILTTTHEHEGATVGMEFVEKYKGVVIKKLHLPIPVRTKHEVIEAVQRQITAKTRLVILSHVNTVSGLVMPFAEISKITKTKGIYLVADGAQAAGLIKIDVAALGVDAYATSGHKWLLGPKETGFLFVNKKTQAVLQSVFMHSGLKAYSASSGTRNVANIIGLGAAIDFHQQVGVEKIQQRCLELRNYCVEKLLRTNGVKVISPLESNLSCGIISFELEKSDSKEVFLRLKEQEIVVKKLSQGNYLRISCHIFVSKKEIDLFITALNKILSS